MMDIAADVVDFLTKLNPKPQGGVTKNDAVFLAGMVEMTKPKKIIEVGVAAGISSAVFLKCLMGQGSGRLYSYDALDYFYVEPSRRLGFVVFEQLPEALNRWKLNSKKTAREAGREHRSKDVELAFIDARHSHPWPTIDLWLLLPALAQDAWVVLHDIALAVDPSRADVGAEILFKKWPGEKRVSPESPNIGAIKLSGNRDVTRQWLRAVLLEDWQDSIPVKILKDEGLFTWLHDKMKPENFFQDRLLPEILRNRNSSQPLAVWGAQQHGKDCIKCLRKAGLEVSFLVDSQLKNVGRRVEGLKVSSPEILQTLSPKPYVVIANLYAGRSSDKLKTMGYEASKNFGIFIDGMMFKKETRVPLSQGG
mgnify:CR=1 FL=1